MTTYYLIRRGWNLANQWATGGRSGPRDTFESRLDMLVDIIEADSPEKAVAKCSASVYANQSLRAVSNPRAIKGLTREIRNR
jgi:uncharacterized protein with von Willebrand factor type A (vWA) domain